MFFGDDLPVVGQRSSFGEEVEVLFNEFVVGFLVKIDRPGTWFPNLCRNYYFGAERKYVRAFAGC